MQMLAEMPPEELGRLIAEAQDPQQYDRTGNLFKTEGPGMMGVSPQMMGQRNQLVGQVKR